ncbi:MAG: hypothetical protein ABIQ95_00170 [Bdellovibrionia bacterium]
MRLNQIFCRIFLSIGLILSNVRCAEAVSETGGEAIEITETDNETAVIENSNQTPANEIGTVTGTDLPNYPPSVEEILQVIRGVDLRTAEMVEEAYGVSNERKQKAAELKRRQIAIKLDKEKINSALEEVLSLLELRRGKATLYLGGKKLQEFVSITQDYSEPGDAQRWQRLLALQIEVQGLKKGFYRVKKLKLNQEQTQQTIDELREQNVSEFVLGLLRNRFVLHLDQVKSVGCKAGVGIFAAGELGLGFGKLINSFGKRFLILEFLERGFFAQFGPSVGLTYHTGSVMSGRVKGEEIGEGGMIVIGGVQNSVGSDSKLNLFEVQAGGLMASDRENGVAIQSLRVLPLPGRSYKMIREQLGIIYSDVQV